MRQQFTFYRSFYLAIKKMKKQDAATLVLAICAYALDGEEPKLTDNLSGTFELIRPTLDCSARKSENGRKGGSKREQTEASESKEQAKAKSKREQSASEKENEVENEVEVEVEVENECLNNTTTPTPPPVNEEAAKTVRAFQDKLGTFLSTTASRELIAFSDSLGSELCTHALDAALDNGHREWSYIRAILSRYKEAGYTTVAQVIDDENERKAQRVKPNQVVAKGMNWTADDMKQMLDVLDKGDL